MKVLICVRRLDKGGAEMLECRLACTLNKQGVEAHVLAQYGKDKFEGEYFSEKWKQQGIPSIYFFNSKNNIGLIKSLWTLFNVLKREKYNVIISTNSGLDTIIGIIRFFLNYKQIIAFHTYINTSILKHYRIKAWSFFVKKADAYYSITDYVKKNVDDVLQLNPAKNKTIYNSIEKVNLADMKNKWTLRKELGLADQAKIILIAGRIESRKGFDLVVEYLSSILLQNDAYLLVAGEGYEGNALEKGLNDFVNTFTNKIKDLGLSEKVLLLGYRDDLDAIMKESTLYVHLARHEGFGLVLLEAIAAKLPIVASNVGGIPEVLKNTPYKTFDLNDEQGICIEASRLLTMNKEEKNVIVNEAYKILPYYTDERRGTEIKQLLNNLMQ
ncbi:MAG: glycosyltransferase family 4 protein [Cytophagaceae bacterium]|nr:glycosyltransferase family 4 protein [Cytophagaceae bacterium]